MVALGAFLPPSGLKAFTFQLARQLFRCSGASNTCCQALALLPVTASLWMIATFGIVRPFFSITCHCPFGPVILPGRWYLLRRVRRGWQDCCSEAGKNFFNLQTCFWPCCNCVQRSPFSIACVLVSFHLIPVWGWTTPRLSVYSKLWLAYFQQMPSTWIRSLLTSSFNIRKSWRRSSSMDSLSRMPVLSVASSLPCVSICLRTCLFWTVLWNIPILLPPHRLPHGLLLTQVLHCFDCTLMVVGLAVQCEWLLRTPRPCWMGTSLWTNRMLRSHFYKLCL